MITFLVRTHTPVVIGDDSPIGKFLRNKLDIYKEPQREGTKKGDRIGFSKKKYLATLMMLFNTTQDCIAQAVGVSVFSMRFGLMQQTKYISKQNHNKSK